MCTTDTALQEALKKEEQKTQQPLQETKTDLYEHAYRPDFMTADLRSAHEIKSKIGSVRDAIKDLMPEVYQNMNRVLSDPNADERTSVLHHSRGTELLRDSDASNVLEFDMAGSGFEEFRNEKKGFHGKGDHLVDGKQVKVPKEQRQLQLSWYNRLRITNWIPGIRTPEGIEKENKRRITQYNGNPLVQQFGEQQIVNGKRMDYIRQKVSIEKDETTKKVTSKTRITMAGPLALKGAANEGDYSIQNLREYMLEMGKNYLTGIMLQWKNGLKPPSTIPIIIKGHSRGAVAAVEGAMMINKWVHDVFPEYADYVKYELTQYDPVPGTGSRFGVHAKVDHDSKEEYSKRGSSGSDKMLPLGKSAETTVVYSLQTEHSHCFTPQEVQGAKRVILTPFKHGAGLDQVDESNVKQGEETELTSQRHGASYTNAATGDVYRGSGINELGEGVYIVDEANNLIRFDNFKQASDVIDKILKNVKGQQSRHEIILRVVESWFRAHAKGQPQNAQQ